MVWSGITRSRANSSSAQLLGAGIHRVDRDDLADPISEIGLGLGLPACGPGSGSIGCVAAPIDSSSRATFAALIVSLVLLSAFLHAAWNALLRMEPDKDRALVAAIAVATLVSIAVALLRWFGDAAPPFPTVVPLVWAIVAGVLEVVYFTSLAKALESGPLGPVYTISRGGAVLGVWPTSIVLFHEAVTWTGLAGSAIVLGGLALASSGSGDTRETRRNALAWSIACAAAIAGYHLAYKVALREGGSPSAVFAVGMAVATIINIVRLGRDGRAGSWRIARTRAFRVIVMGVICGGSFLILMEALAGGGAGFVLTLRNTSVLFATGLAFAIGERPRHAQITGAAFVAAGATLMAW